MAEKSFAIFFVILMAIPALPLPTGGITHVFEIITALVALEMVAGLRTIWLPKKWLQRPLGKHVTGKTIPHLIKNIRWLERYTKPRLGWVVNNRLFQRLIGLVVIGFTAGAFFAPPFSGLDTLPALGVVLLGLAIMLDDIVLIIAGILVGAGGLLLEITLGSALVTLVRHWW